MKRSHFIIAIGLLIFFAGIVFPFSFQIPTHTVFTGDDLDYSRGAENLLELGMYSFDGKTLTNFREPGMSFFLTGLYRLFGVRNIFALFFVQTVLFFLASVYFCHQISKVTNQRIGFFTLVLLLTSGSVLHSIFSAYRECLTLILLLFFCGLSLHQWFRFLALRSILLGILLAMTILTYYSFLFFVPFLLIFWMYEKQVLRHLSLVFIVCMMIVGGWAIRNAGHGKGLRIVDSTRQGVMWYVRGQQAEKIQGLLPARCLLAEYLTRSWQGLPHECSYNATWHLRWPKGMDAYPEASFLAGADEGKAKILAHPFSYAWFSLFEILELHAPFVGGGWSTKFNVYAALTQLIVGIGFLFGIRKMWSSSLRLMTVLLLFNTALFIFTDATPRYLIPVFFCYALLAACGYDTLLKRYFPSL